MRLRHSLLLFVLVVLVFLIQSCTFEEFLIVNFDLLLQNNIPKNRWTPVFLYYFLHDFELQPGYVRVIGSYYSHDTEIPKVISIGADHIDDNGQRISGTPRVKVNSKVKDGHFDTTRKYPGDLFLAGEGVKGLFKPKNSEAQKDDRVLLMLIQAHVVDGELFSQLDVDMGIENRVLMATVEPESLAEVSIDNSDDIGTVKVNLLEKGTGKLNIIYMDSEGQFHEVSYPLKCN